MICITIRVRGDLMSNKLGAYLKELRGDRSLRDIANLSNNRINHAYLSTVEKATSHRGTPFTPPPDKIKILAEIYQVDYNYLLELAGYIEPTENNTTNSIEQELNKMIRDLTHGDAQSINDMDENTKELLIMSLENSLRIAQRESKKK